MPRIHQHPGAIGKLGQNALIIFNILEQIPLVIAYVEGKIGDALKHVINTRNKIFTRFVCAITAFEIGTLQPQSARKMDIPFDLAHIVSQIAFVRAGIASRNIANIEARERNARIVQTLPHHTHRCIRVNGRTLGKRAKKFNAIKARFCGNVQRIGQK